MYGHKQQQILELAVCHALVDNPNNSRNGRLHPSPCIILAQDRLAEATTLRETEGDVIFILEEMIHKVISIPSLS